jgi:cytidylate kinase
VRAHGLDEGSQAAAVARRLFALAARGSVVVVGRAAGHVLPADTTLSVRLVAPAEDRTKYLSDRLRLSAAEAAAARDSHDRSRAEFLRTVCGRDITDPTGYDLVLNVARLGVDGAADLIAAAARRKFPDVPA